MEYQLTKNKNYRFNVDRIRLLNGDSTQKYKTKKKYEGAL